MVIVEHKSLTEQDFVLPAERRLKRTFCIRRQEGRSENHKRSKSEENEETGAVGDGGEENA